MMNNLIKKYKHKIAPGEKSIEELVDYLKHKMDIVKIPTSVLPESYLKHIIFNVIHCLRNEELNISLGKNIDLHPFTTALKVSKSRTGKQEGVHIDTAEKIRNLNKQSYDIPKESNLTTDDLNFVTYKILKNPKSNSYYQYNYAHLSVQGDDFIFVIFETRTGVIHCNSSKLMLELHIEQGISQFDYDNETILLIDYLSSLDQYSNGEY